MKVKFKAVAQEKLGKQLVQLSKVIQKFKKFSIHIPCQLILLAPIHIPSKDILPLLFQLVEILLLQILR